MAASLTHHLETLCVEIGARPIGSPANDRAAGYIRDVFAALGWVVEEQPYACIGWDCAAASLAVGDEVLAVEANAFSPACDVTAPAVPASTLDELAAADLAGKIALLYGELVSSPLSPKSWFLKEARDDAIIDLLVAKRPAAVLAPPPPTVQYEQFTGDWELEIPAATAPLPVIARLLAQPGVLHLRLDCAKYAATARNIVARKPGPRRPGVPAQRVTLMAHFDTRINTPGALDNGGGVAALLGLAEALAGRELPFDLELVAFNGEEYLPIGDDEYVRRAGEASFGGDPAGRQYGRHRLHRRRQHHRPVQHRAGARHPVGRDAGSLSRLQTVEPWPESNHSTFAFRGVPALAFSSHDAFTLAHFPADTVSAVSIDKLTEVVAVVQEIVQRMFR